MHSLVVQKINMVRREVWITQKVYSKRTWTWFSTLCIVHLIHTCIWVFRGPGCVLFPANFLFFFFFSLVETLIRDSTESSQNSLDLSSWTRAVPLPIDSKAWSKCDHPHLVHRSKNISWPLCWLNSGESAWEVQKTHPHLSHCMPDRSPPLRLLVIFLVWLKDFILTMEGVWISLEGFLWACEIFLFICKMTNCIASGQHRSLFMRLILLSEINFPLLVQYKDVFWCYLTFLMDLQNMYNYKRLSRDTHMLTVWAVLMSKHGQTGIFFATLTFQLKTHNLILIVIL